MPLVIANLHRRALAQFLTSLQHGDESLYPKYWSDDESSPRLRLTAESFETLLATSQLRDGGYCLHADTYSIGVGMLGSEVQLFIDCVSDITAERIFELLGSVEVIYAFACSESALLDQNRLVKKMPYGLNEMWVGRDFTRYLPGLYWLNLFGKPYPANWDLEDGDFVDIALSMRRTSGGGLFIKTHDKSDDWKEAKPRLDKWKSGRPKVFQKSLPQKELEAVNDFLAATAVSRRWK